MVRWPLMERAVALCLADKLCMDVCSMPIACVHAMWVYGHKNENIYAGLCVIAFEKWGQVECDGKALISGRVFCK